MINANPEPTTFACAATTVVGHTGTTRTDGTIIRTIAKMGSLASEREESERSHAPQNVPPTCVPLSFAKMYMSTELRP